MIQKDKNKERLLMNILFTFIFTNIILKKIYNSKLTLIFRYFIFFCGISSLEALPLARLHLPSTNRGRGGYIFQKVKEDPILDRQPTWICLEDITFSTFKVADQYLTFSVEGLFSSKRPMYFGTYAFNIPTHRNLF